MLIITGWGKGRDERFLVKGLGLKPIWEDVGGARDVRASQSSESPEGPHRTAVGGRIRKRKENESPECVGSSAQGVEWKSTNGGS